MPHPLLLCLDFLQNAQKECGLALLILCCRDASETLIAQEIRNQFTLTDAAQERLKNLPLLYLERLKPLCDALGDLPERRIDIMSRFARPSAIQNWYEASFLAPLRALVTDILIEDPLSAPLQISALLHLMDWNRETTRIRNAGAEQANVPGWLDNKDLRVKLRPLIQNQMAYERLFFALADDMQKQTIATLKAGSPANSGYSDELCAALFTDRSMPTLKDMAGLDWFSIFTAKTDFLYNAAKTISARILEGREEGAALVSMPLDMDVESQLDMIRSLPLFKGLTPLTLASLLRAARIVHIEKGDTLVAQGAATHKFYILLDGWMKVCKGNAEGEEAILQILGKKEVLLDTGLMQTTPSPVSAKAVTKANLLMIPVNVLREHMAQHKELVTNILAATTHRLSRLTAHFEQVTLRNATERVGWFLLNLYRETGLEGMPLALPYDKALIASFLNIKPETFSRVLQALKQQGFKIEKHQIIMPTPRALCDYCDFDIAFRCCNAESEECPRVELRRFTPGTPKKAHA